MHKLVVLVSFCQFSILVNLNLAGYFLPDCRGWVIGVRVCVSVDGLDV